MHGLKDEYKESEKRGMERMDTLTHIESDSGNWGGCGEFLSIESFQVGTESVRFFRIFMFWMIEYVFCFYFVGTLSSHIVRKISPFLFRSKGAGVYVFL